MQVGMWHQQVPEVVQTLLYWFENVVAISFPQSVDGVLWSVVVSPFPLRE